MIRNLSLSQWLETFLGEKGNTEMPKIFCMKWNSAFFAFLFIAQGTFEKVNKFLKNFTVSLCTFLVLPYVGSK